MTEGALPIVRQLTGVQILAREAMVAPTERIGLQLQLPGINQAAGVALDLAVTQAQAQVAIGIRPPARNPFAF